jgi:2-keto-4-pentenoate hydratase/2-oxohepta-3-ene-1,7-dioic acid hydratase in catechol pathway
VFHQGAIHPVRFAPDGTLHVTHGPAPLFGADTGRTIPFADATVLSPVSPGKIVCIGRNYRAHAKELGNEVPAEPLLFLKPPSALVGPGDAVVLPPESARVEHEGELAVVIGQRIRRAKASEARGAIAGYTCANDVTARDLQRKDVQFTRGKGFDTFCPLGPWLVTERPGEDAMVTVRVNGTRRQHGALRDMVFGIDTLVAFISDVMTLEPGDVILTGTPEGVGPLLAGDTVEVEISGVGTLSNPVRAEEGAAGGH